MALEQGEKSLDHQGLQGHTWSNMVTGHGQVVSMLFVLRELRQHPLLFSREKLCKLSGFLVSSLTGTSTVQITAGLLMLLEFFG